MNTDTASMVGVAIGLSALGYWAFTPAADFIHTVGEAAIFYVIVLGVMTLVMALRKPKA